MYEHLIAITFALLIDAIVGDPPHLPHPVKWIGSCIAFFEKKWNQLNYRKAKGVGMVLIIVSVVIALTALLVSLSYSIHPIVGILVESIIIATTIARKGLKDAALEVYEPLINEDLKTARVKLSYIVGRDTDKLDEGEIVRGTVETVAENTSDGVTAPMFWALIGGAPLAMMYRAINTCDSMVGYKNEKYVQFGWASARLDDVVNWIPSRLTGFLMMLFFKPKLLTRKRAWNIFFRDAKSHPSPNSGWTEAAVAALLGVQLGGINYYGGHISDRAKLGEPLVPLTRDHILQTNRILTGTTVAFLFLLWIGGVLIEMAFTWF